MNRYAYNHDFVKHRYFGYKGYYESQVFKFKGNDFSFDRFPAKTHLLDIRPTASSLIVIVSSEIGGEMSMGMNLFEDCYEPI